MDEKEIKELDKDIAIKTIKKASDLIIYFSKRDPPFDINRHQYKEELELKVALKYF